MGIIVKMIFCFFVNSGNKSIITVAAKNSIGAIIPKTEAANPISIQTNGAVINSTLYNTPLVKK